MPRATFAAEVSRQQQLMGVRRFGVVLVDDQRDKQSAYREIITRMAATYRVSRISTQIRLRELQLVVDQRTVWGEQRVTGPMPIGSVLQRLLGTWLDGTSDDGAGQ